MKEECYKRSGTVLAPGASFEGRVREVRFRRSGTVLAPAASFKESSLLTVWDSFWLREPVLREVRYKRSGTIFGPGSQV